MQEASAWNPAKISAAHRALFSAREDLDLPHAVHLRKRAHQRLNALRDAAGLGRDRHGGTAVCRNCLIDRQYICAELGKNGEYAGKQARHVPQQQLEGQNAASHQVLERRDGIAILVKCTAADARGARGVIHRCDLTGLQQPLCLGDLEENLRQRLGLHDIVFRKLCHIWLLLFTRDVQMFPEQVHSNISAPKMHAP